VNVNHYLAKQYDNPPCWLLVADVYEHELGKTVKEYRTVTNTIREISARFRLELHKGEHGFEQVSQPRDFSVVLLSRFPREGWHHVGVFYEGGVLHALPTGNLYQDMASLGDTYSMMQFWSRQ
jgi:hypothetical protein